MYRLKYDGGVAMAQFREMVKHNLLVYQYTYHKRLFFPLKMFTDTKREFKFMDMVILQK